MRNFLNKTLSKDTYEQMFSEKTWQPYQLVVSCFFRLQILATLSYGLNDGIFVI